MSGVQPIKIDKQGIKLISEDEEKSITLTMEGDEKGIILDYDVSGTPNKFSITSGGVNWTDGSNNYTTSLERLSEVETIFQAVLKPPDATTLVVNKQLNLDDGLDNIGSIGLDGSNNLVVSGKDVVVSTGIGTVTEQFRINDIGNWNTSGGLTYNNTTNTLTANTFFGTLDGNMDADNILVTSDNTSGTYFLTFVKTTGTGLKSLFFDDDITRLTYSPGTCALSANSFLSLHQFQGFPENTADTTTITSLTGIDKWAGGVLAPNGKIYGIPYNSSTFLVIDPVANTADTSGNLTVDAAKWSGGVLAPNGKIYGIPYNSSSILIIDPATNTADISGNLTGDAAKWLGGVLAPNGKIYGIPYNSSSILIIDPATNTADISGNLTGDAAKWAGGVLAPNGKIYGIPYNSTSILIIDPATNTVDTSTITNLTGISKWSGGVLAPNGKIYCIPSNSEIVLIIDPATNTADTTTITSLGGISKWFGGILGQNGKIYGIPYNSTSNLIIDPATNTADISTITNLNGSSKWFGGVLAPNGKIYGIPSASTSGLILNTGLPILPNWVLQSYYNKF